MKRTLLTLILLAAVVFTAHAADKKLLIIAGKPSHPPLMHEFRAGALLLQKSLASVKGLSVEVHTNGWVADNKLLETADAVFIFADGGPRHPVVQEDHLELLRKQIARGLGFGCAHYAVEVPPNQGGEEFKSWIGGHYEHQFSVNPIWEPEYKSLPKHPIANGVKPFSTKDEWYFNMRFSEVNVGLVPLLVSRPSDAVRDGPYVYPKGPFEHIQGAKGRDEVMMWAVERPDGGRGFGFTGGHFHLNWGNDDQRKIVLNALLWISKVEIPKNGVESQVTEAELMQNLDPKPDPRKPVAPKAEKK
jgi:hypothetical protein